MLQQPEPGDYVVASGKMHSVRDLCQIAFDHLGLDWEKHVEIDPQFLRPAEVDRLCGDASKAHKELEWEPSVDFEGLIKLMVEADMEWLKNG